MVTLVPSKVPSYTKKRARSGQENSVMPLPPPKQLKSVIVFYYLRFGPLITYKFNLVRKSNLPKLAKTTAAKTAVTADFSGNILH